MTTLRASVPDRAAAPSPLREPAFLPLPPGSVEPRGWLRSQLEFMADGLVGRLPELSKWVRFEGSAWTAPDGRGEHPWEEAPYWLKGLGALGYALGDERLVAEFTRWAEAILAARSPDGYLGPRANVEEKPGGGFGPLSGERVDLWPNMLAVDVLRLHHEATGDPRVIDALTAYFRWQLALPQDDLLPGYWGRLRGGDNLDAVHWLYDRTGEDFLLRLAERLHRATAPWSEGVPDRHGVNIAQGFREPAIWWRQSHDPADLAAAERNYREVMDAYGAVPGGMFGADENARPGRCGPRQAAETCSMVEFMHSFQVLARITGDPAWADRCEDVAFNSLPASHTPDLRALHYLTAPNQPVLDRADKSPGIGNGGDMFSYDPRRYRCCQHNAGQGWPFFARSAWAATADGGLAKLFYAPGRVSAEVGGSGGSADAETRRVSIEEHTNYPFDGRVRLRIETPAPAEFPLLLRIPGWAAGARASVNGRPVDAEARPGAFLRLERRWEDGDGIELDFPMRIEVRRWSEHGGAVSVRRGPLWYALRIGEEKRVYWKDGDWEASELWPTTPWNYALVLDEPDPAAGIAVEAEPGSAGPLAPQPFTIDDAPVRLRARARRVPSWGLEPSNLVRELIPGPVRCEGPAEEVTLVPMGAARLRISVFPVAGRGDEGSEWPPLDATPPEAAPDAAGPGDA